MSQPCGKLREGATPFGIEQYSSNFPHFNSMHEPYVSKKWNGTVMDIPEKMGESEFRPLKNNTGGKNIHVIIEFQYIYFIVFTYIFVKGRHNEVFHSTVTSRFDRKWREIQIFLSFYSRRAPYKWPRFSTTISLIVVKLWWWIRNIVRVIVATKGNSSFNYISVTTMTENLRLGGSKFSHKCTLERTNKIYHPHWFWQLNLYLYQSK